MHAIKIVNEIYSDQLIYFRPKKKKKNQLIYFLVTKKKKQIYFYCGSSKRYQNESLPTSCIKSDKSNDQAGGFAFVPTHHCQQIQIWFNPSYENWYYTLIKIV